MKDRIRWIEHKGKNILFADYSNVNEKQESIPFLVEIPKWLVALRSLLKQM